MGIKHKKVLAGPNGTDNTRVQPTDWNDEHEIDSLNIPNNTNPTLPAAGNLTLFGRLVGGRMMPAFMGPSGLDTAIQPLLGRNSWSYWAAAGGSTTLVVSGAATAFTAVGTATTAAMALTNLHTKIKRLDYLVTTAATTAVAGWRTAVNYYCREIGYQIIIRGAPATGAATATGRFFMGLTTSVANPTDVSPASLTNMIGFGYDSGDTQLSLFHNDSAGTATKIPLGVDFPKYTTDRATMYELNLFTAAGGAGVNYQIRDLTTGKEVSGIITSADQPTASTFLSPRCYASAGGTSSVIGVAFASMYIESDN